jgi:hypothetical protein
VDCADAAHASTGVYGINDVITNASSEVCFWLPDTGGGGTAMGTVGLTADGLGYERAYVRLGTPQPQTLVAAPTLVSVTPFETAAPLTGEVALTFSGAMNTAAPGARIRLIPEAGAPVTLGPGTWSQGGAVYTAPYGGLAPLTPYTVEISGFRTGISSLALPLDDTYGFTTGGSFTATLTPSSYDFGSLDKGYTSPTHTFTITNTGTGTLSGLTVFLEGPDAVAFASALAPSGLASSGLSPQAAYTLAPGQHVTVEAHPVEGLAARSAPYTAALRVTASNDIDLAAPLSFTVKAPAGPLPKSGDASSLVLSALAVALAALGVGAIAIALHRRKTGR